MLFWLIFKEADMGVSPYAPPKGACNGRDRTGNDTGTILP